MSQHHNPLERTDDRPGGPPDAANEGATSIGNDAGVFNDVSAEAPRDHADSADSGRDPNRSAAINQAQSDDTLSPPPAAYRPDSVVRATGPFARVEMERSNAHENETSFTKGNNAPTANQMQGSSKTTDAFDEYLEGSPRGIFPSTPGGAGATPLSRDRHAFISDVASIGHFPSLAEAEKWTRAVFNAIRHHVYEVDDRALMDELKQAVRFGEAPEVQVEEMMWGGDFVDRFIRMTALLQNWPRNEFYQQIAEEAGETVDDPWVDAAVHSFFGALKRSLGDDANRSIGNLGELQDVWDRA